MKTRYDQVVLGIDYLLSKRTTAGVAFGKIYPASDNSYCNNGTGTGNANLFVACAKEQAVGLQLLHNF